MAVVAAPAGSAVSDAADAARRDHHRWWSSVDVGVMVVPLGVVLPVILAALVAGLVVGALVMDAATRQSRSRRPAPVPGRHRRVTR